MDNVVNIDSTTTDSTIDQTIALVTETRDLAESILNELTK